MSCTSTQQVRFQLRRGNNDYWESDPVVNSIPLPGEPCFNTTTNQLKIGNGLSTWGQLPYINVAGPIGTYTSLEALTTISNNVSYIPGEDIFRLAAGDNSTWPLFGQIQFTGATVPAPLIRYVSYYALKARSSSGPPDIYVSETPAGPNVILLIDYVNKAGSLITIVHPANAEYFQIGRVIPGQAVMFRGVPHGESPPPVDSGLSPSVLYYLVGIAPNGSYHRGTGEAIIIISETRFGSAIN